MTQLGEGFMTDGEILSLAGRAGIGPGGTWASDGTARTMDLWTDRVGIDAGMGGAPASRRPVGTEG